MLIIIAIIVLVVLKRRRKRRAQAADSSAAAPETTEVVTSRETNVDIGVGERIQDPFVEQIEPSATASGGSVIPEARQS